MTDQLPHEIINPHLKVIEEYRRSSATDASAGADPNDSFKIKAMIRN